MNDMQSFVMNLINNPSDTRNQINDFSKTIQGSPKAQVDQLISNGQMSQGTYNILSKFANILMKLF